MGANITRRLLRHGHECVVFNRSPHKVKQLVDEGEGAQGTYSLDDFVRKLTNPPAAWIMVLAGEATEQMVMKLADKLEPGDIILDGGNSYYKMVSQAHNLGNELWH